jgi:hypothetical protein
MLRFRNLLQYYIYKTLNLCSLICHILTVLINFEITRITPFMMIFERLVSGVWWYPPHIVLCFCFVCLRLVSGVWWYPPHIVLCFLFCLSSLYVLCTQCCQFLCIVHCPLGLSNICIHSTYLRLITIPPSNILRIAIEISFENHHEGCNSSNFKVDEHS